MKIYLLRHWQTLEWENWIILWQKWWNLSEKWIEEMNKIWNFLKLSDLWIKKIYTSDLKRAVDSANIINNYLNIEIEKCEILKERWCWKVEWKRENEINWEEYEKNKLPYRKHDWWESFIDVKNRAKIFLEKIKNNDFNSLIISHSVFILMLIWLIQKKSIEKSIKLNLKNRIICIDFENIVKIEFREYNYLEN